MWCLSIPDLFLRPAKLKEAALDDVREFTGILEKARGELEVPWFQD